MTLRFLQGFIIGLLFMALTIFIDTNRFAYLSLLLLTPTIFLITFYKDLK